MTSRKFLEGWFGKHANTCSCAALAIDFNHHHRSDNGTTLLLEAGTEANQMENALPSHSLRWSRCIFRRFEKNL